MVLGAQLQGGTWRAEEFSKYVSIIQEDPGEIRLKDLKGELDGLYVLIQDRLKYFKGELD